MGLRMWYLGMIRFLSRMSEFFMRGKNKTQYMSMGAMYFSECEIG